MAIGLTRFFLVAAGLLVAQSGWAATCLVEPVKISRNMVTSVFGKSRALPQYGGAQHIHWGVDMQARKEQNRAVGAELVAVDNGTIIGAGFWGSGYGNRVALKRDNGDIVIYSHLSKVDPKIKSGGSVGFKDAAGGVGDHRVQAGEVIGVAGGTANHVSNNERAIHLHLEYVTGYGGTKIRETNDGTNATRSRYMRNPIDYMCRAIPHAPGAGVETGSPGRGTVPVPSGGSVTAKSDVPSSDEQIKEASAIQPQVTEQERYGMPDSPPYETYAGMSESQIVETELLRRTLDTEWETKLTGWSKRGLWAEIARMRGVKLWAEARIAEKYSRIEGMLSTRLAFQTNQYFNPRLNASFSRAQAAATAQKVK